MTIVNGADFKIEPRHLQEGLSSQDFSRIAGYKVVAVPLDDFPHWKQVVQSVALSQAQAKEREQALFNVLSSSQPQRGAQILAKESITIRSPFITKRRRGLCSFPDIEQTIAAFAPTGTDSKTGSFRIDKERSVILAHPHVMRNEPDSLNVPVSAHVFLPPQDTPLKAIWSDITHIPQDRMIRFPQDPLIHVMSHLHESRHLVQLDHSTNTRADFWNELDADMFMFHAIGQTAAGKQARTAWLHFRYLNIVSSSPRYWVAPHLEAAQDNRAPPTQNAVIEAARNVQQQIYIASFGSVRKSLLQRMPSFVDDRYTKWKTKNVRKHPEIGFPLLRSCVETNCFSKNPLADTIARNVLAAVEYFSPGLSHPKM